MLLRVWSFAHASIAMLTELPSKCRGRGGLKRSSWMRSAPLLGPSLVSSSCPKAWLVRRLVSAANGLVGMLMVLVLFALGFMKSLNALLRFFIFFYCVSATNGANNYGFFFFSFERLRVLQEKYEGVGDIRGNRVNQGLYSGAFAHGRFVSCGSSLSLGCMDVLFPMDPPHGLGAWAFCFLRLLPMAWVHGCFVPSIGICISF